MGDLTPTIEQRVIGRYAVYSEIASGGMATVYFGRLLGPVGFSRTVAIKRLHPQFARDPEFVSMFLDEARMAARIRHPNVIPMLDVVATEGELFLVMDYVQGESLGRLLRTKAGLRSIPPRVAVSIVSQALQGLNAAHEATDERGLPMKLVHRDVSPQNVLVGVDGMARVLDFGIAKAVGRAHTTREGQIKGKLAYMAPEQLQYDQVTRKADVYAAAVVLWEALVGARLFPGETEALVLAKILSETPRPPSAHKPGLPRALDEVVMRGLCRDPTVRYETAREFAVALEHAVSPASHMEVAEWLDKTAGATLKQRAALVSEIESATPVPSAMGGGGSHEDTSDPSLRVTTPPMRGREPSSPQLPTSTRLGIGPISTPQMPITPVGMLPLGDAAPETAREGAAREPGVEAKPTLAPKRLRPPAEEAGSQTAAAMELAGLPRVKRSSRVLAVAGAMTVAVVILIVALVRARVARESQAAPLPPHATRAAARDPTPPSESTPANAAPVAPANAAPVAPAARTGTAALPATAAPGLVAPPAPSGPAARHPAAATSPTPAGAARNPAPRNPTPTPGGAAAPRPQGPRNALDSLGGRD